MLSSFGQLIATHSIKIMDSERKSRTIVPELFRVQYFLSVIKSQRYTPAFQLVMRIGTVAKAGKEARVRAVKLSKNMI